MMNFEKEIDVNKVAKECKKIGEFIMFKCESGCLLITDHFMLSLTPDQFWKVQCKLELPERGVWYLQKKGKVVASERAPEIELLEEKYNACLNGIGKQLEYTGLTCKGTYLYSDGKTYTAISCAYRDMVEYTENIRRISELDYIVTWDGIHTLTVWNDLVWKDNKYIKGAEQ